MYCKLFVYVFSLEATLCNSGKIYENSKYGCSHKYSYHSFFVVVVCIKSI